MKPSYYKTNGRIDVVTSSGGCAVLLKCRKDVIILEKNEVEFLMKCFNDLLEE